MEIWHCAIIMLSCSVYSIILYGGSKYRLLLLYQYDMRGVRRGLQVGGRVGGHITRFIILL